MLRSIDKKDENPVYCKIRVFNAIGYGTDTKIVYSESEYDEIVQELETAGYREFQWGGPVSMTYKTE